MEIHLVQYSPEWENKLLNKEKLTELLQSSFINSPGKSDVPRLIILPEMTLTGFTMDSPKYSEELKGKSFQFYQDLALRYNSFLAGGIIETSEDKYYNTLMIISPQGELVSYYRKIHPFSYSREDKFYTRGSEPVMADISGWKIGLTICYDLRFPELYRRYGKGRADLIINIANWPVTRIEHWKILLRARAIENQCYIAGVNRTGMGNKLTYNGCSAVFDPMGNEVILANDEERIFSSSLDKNLVQSTRQKFPFLDDIFLI